MLAGLPQIIPQKVWSFRAWRKLFPEWFGISALSESHFPKGLVFPRMAKVISRMVWHFRAWRKSFPERFGISALGESRFPNGLTFPRMAKVVSRMVWCFRAWRKSSLESLMFAYLAMKGGVVILVEFYCKGMTLNFRH